MYFQCRESLIRSAVFVAFLLFSSAVGVAQVHSLPETPQFGSVAVGLSGKTVPVTLTNVGTTALQISQLSVQGDFTQTNECGEQIQPGSSCTLAVIFHPTAAGPRDGKISIGNTNVSLIGIGAPLEVSPGDDAGEVRVGDVKNDAIRFTLTNHSQATVAFESIAVGGDFTQSNDCGTEIAPAHSCSVTVAFRPTQPNGRESNLLVTTKDPSFTVSRSVHGTGRLE
jgi:archaellum component FlaF (FlaF/FlaG flagellin family)